MSKKIHYERMNKVIQSIENNLDSKININELSKIACYSKFHFHRLFRSFFGGSTNSGKTFVEWVSIYQSDSDSEVGDFCNLCRAFKFS